MTNLRIFIITYYIPSTYPQNQQRKKKEAKKKENYYCFIFSSTNTKFSSRQ